jgi:hypothetical protein
MPKEVFSITSLVNSDGCFDIQFRKDTRHERTNAPTYYRWKAQFIITSCKENEKVLEKVRKEFGCGSICISGNQVRFSVQKIDDIYDLIIPYFKKNQLADKKKKDFMLFVKAVEIIQKNKGKNLTAWKKNDLLSLIEIQKSAVKYKNRPREPKWIQMAQTVAKSIK